MNVRQFAEQDLAAILAIQSKCPEAAQWREEDYTRLARDSAGILLTAEPEAVVCATSATGQEGRVLGSNGACGRRNGERSLPGSVSLVRVW